MYLLLNIKTLKEIKITAVKKINLKKSKKNKKFNFILKKFINSKSNTMEQLRDRISKTNIQKIDENISKKFIKEKKFIII